MAFANLPARGERSAPTFDESQLEELERYFTDLQTLLDRFGVVDENERKLAALCYLKIHTEGLWKTTSAWLDPTKSYAEFKAEVFKLYPGVSGNRTYTIRGLRVHRTLLKSRRVNNGLLRCSRASRRLFRSSRTIPPMNRHL